ncbi:uncharacterized protein BDZ99DRAFT_564845 [Mytilinidion resinicola]|uniref:Fermentation associated protein n=1 Tax=Mytilinidion resinicola TaxID=574789 RepID=A0A6A6ZA07_9PEZI|nr:uncharacterized protein BDZ99DRAFT_564845 [Mytilinidion resinicola]KAF2817037.1 hypothetical protein BDZ99DRAFT_564845 [Mytilinidion resinicola]
MAAEGLTAQPLNPQDGFNWVFLVELLVCGILSIFFLFYFNRVFGTLVSYAIRAYTWHTYQAYIDIQALQISLLGGRIFFKDIRYHAQNETILVHGGYITWQYWLRKVKDAEIFAQEELDSRPEGGSDTSSSDGGRRRNRHRDFDEEAKGAPQKKKSLPSRITIKVSGVEVFMYNRSSGYDGIVEAILRNQDDGSDGSASSNFERSRSGASANQKHKHEVNLVNRIKKTHTSESTEPDAPGNSDEAHANTVQCKKEELPAFLRLLPVHIDCNKGAIVIGNEFTPAVITAQFEKASGDFDAAASGPLDMYQQLFSFQFTHPVVHMRPNPDFKRSQLDSAVQLKKDAEGEEPISKEAQKSKVFWSRRRPWHTLWSMHSLFSRSSDSIERPSTRHAKKKMQPPMPPDSKPWKGLARYLDDSQLDEHDEWEAIEYAKTSLVLDCPCINVSFYWDVPGRVSSGLDDGSSTLPFRKGDINGTIPPEYGLDIEIFGGTINYGPWTDRHRAIFQSVFFPASYVDAVPSSLLKPGELRVFTVFKVYLSIEKDTLLRIPLREPSKDWKWKGTATNVAGNSKNAAEKGKSRGKGRRKPVSGNKREPGVPAPSHRPFAWLEIKIAANSTVNYLMDFVASETGYQNNVSVDIRGTEVFSSVNHALLCRSSALSLDCDLSAPLRWNQLRKWLFNISCHDLELFLLRDHLFLITDLVSDWGSGPPSDYFTFTPFQYFLKVDLQNFKLYLNTNDSNIVNNPSDLDDNNFLVVFGQHLRAKLTIPLDRYRPYQTEIPFDVSAEDGGLDLCMPSKSTLQTFVRSNRVAKLGALTVTGSHNYFTETSTANTDRLHLDIHGTKLALDLYGFLIRHFMKIKDNYFGEDMHFKTLEEYQGLPTQSLAVDGVGSGQHFGKSNDLDVILCVSVDQASAFVPANLYSAEDSIRIDLPFVAADLRFTNYYMDLMVNFSPLSVSLGLLGSSPGTRGQSAGPTEIFIESVEIYGHRLFGLPPTEPTYVCNWDFNIGTVSGECTEMFLEKAAGTARSFGFTFDDDENALPLSQPLIIHDSTFLRLRTSVVHIWLHVATEVLLLSTGPITLDFNDLAGPTFSERLKVLVPDLTVACVDARSASRHRTRAGERNTIRTHAYIQTTLSLQMLQRKMDFTVDREEQQSHMQEHDQRTNRTPFFLIDKMTTSTYQPLKSTPPTQPPAMPFPYLPHPISLQTSPKPSGSSTPTPSMAHSSTRFSSLRPQDARGRQLRPTPLRSSSNGSIAESIRNVQYSKDPPHRESFSRSRTLVSRSASRNNTSKYTYALTTEEERERRGLPPSSVALSSSLAAPYFPLDLVEPDLSDVPMLPVASKDVYETEDDMLLFKDASAKAFDESFVHTSFIISADPGIRIHCTPQAIRCAANLVDIISPQQPEDILDAFQVDVVTTILDMQKRRQGKGKSTEMSLRVPFTHIRFVNEFSKQSGDESELEKDQYDVTLDNLNVALRTKDFPGDRAGENSLSLHTTLGSVAIAIKERSMELPGDDVAIQARVDDLLLWVMNAKTCSVNVSFRNFETGAASKKVEYLASLIHRTTLLGTELVERFQTMSLEQLLRLRFLAWRLTTSHNQTPDPAFLTRPSYALRVARDHIRNHDSWKIISRFRFIWASLPELEKQRLKNSCLAKITTCPNDAEAKVIEMWDQWRTWDLSHVKKSLAMRKIYGSFADIEKISSKPIPISLNIRSIGIKLVVDPGPKQSEASIHHVALALSMSPPPEPTGLMLVESETAVQSTSLQINSRNTVVQIKWEICDLVDSLLKLFIKTPSVDQPPDSAISEQGNKLVKQTPSDKLNAKDLHIVYATDYAKISLDGLNLRSVSMGQGLKLSVATSEKEHETTVSILVHAQLAATEMHTRHRLLLISRLDQPSLYLSRYKAEKGKHIEDMKVVGTSRMNTIEVKEDALGFIEIFDLVLRDEIAYLHRQAATFKKPGDLKPLAVEKSNADLPNITMALMMDSYLIQVALLQNLTWSISGGFGRISVEPQLGKAHSLNMHFDLDVHTHKMYNSTSEGSNVIAALDLPPVNGTLSLTQTNNQTVIKASTIIDSITFQASEINGLVTTINKPEISNVVHAARDDLEILKTHFREIFPPADEPLAPSKIQSSTKSLVFGVDFTLNGLNILASAPGKLPSSANATLALKLASIQLKATNISLEDNAILSLPEITAQLSKVSVEMTILEDGTMRHCGNIALGASFHATSQLGQHSTRRVYRVEVPGLEVNLFADTASAVVDVLNHLQDKIKDLDLSKERKYLRRLRHTKSRGLRKESSDQGKENDDGDGSPDALFTSTYSLDLRCIQITWVMGASVPLYSISEPEDLVLSFRRINLSTRKDDAARLMIEDLQLQMIPVSGDKQQRSLNSALLPEVVFNVSYSSTNEVRKLAFQAAGKSLDLRLESHFAIPASMLHRSMSLAGQKFRAASATWKTTPTSSGTQRSSPFGNKKLSSLLVDADFAGAVVHLSGERDQETNTRLPQKGRYSQFVSDGTSNKVSLRAPGVALKVQYKDDGHEPALNAELKVDASSNTLFPTLVPLVMDISNSIKEVVRNDDSESSPQSPQPKPPGKLMDEDNLITADPSAILGKTKLNLGVRICKQEFSLSCQPIARVAATARLDDLYVTVNSVKSSEQGHFFAVSAAIEKLQVAVQHVYSRESTFAFDVDSIVLSLMNSKHLSGTSGISAILKINPMRTQINARQLQDFLLFREIWIPLEIRKASKQTQTNATTEPQEYLVQRYQKVAATAAFPWNANVAIAEVSINLDLGQSIGKTSLKVTNLWASSKKNSDWEQNLCIGVERVGLESQGRTSGFIEISEVQVRTSISWPSRTIHIRQTPLIQASLGFQRLRLKAGFDYQAFAIADIANFDFLMYNVREQVEGAPDRLVAILDGDKVQVFCTATSAAQGLALYQAIERLVLENQQAYAQSLRDIEKFLRRKSSVIPTRSSFQILNSAKAATDTLKAPISLHTDVVLTLRSVNLGIFPSTFTDNQIFMLEVSDAQARFAAALEKGRVHSGLGMTLGKLSVALAAVAQSKKAKTVSELSVEDVVGSAMAARGGTILRVPKVVATMQTWQSPESNHIDYIFKSSLEGKVDVGWNYNRISFIRTMWSNHSRSLASRLGKPLPESALKITTPEKPDTGAAGQAGAGDADGNAIAEREKITAVVNVPQSRYEYTALEPPIIETPQLRDMGEATPPLEWIGLHRDRLPNVTHQIVIVTLLEVAKEVEDAYGRILGNS